MNNLAEIFTVSNKDFFLIEDFQTLAGISYAKAAELIRQIKSVSDVFNITGRVHRVDYYNYIKARCVLLEEK